MTLTTYDKSSSRQGSFIHEQVIAPARGEACSIMNWHDYFIADFEAGTLTWRPRPRENFKREHHWKAWNARFADTIAGSATIEGYRQVKVCGRMWRVHRVIYEMANGAITIGYEIDHIDGCKNNNALSNLRIVTHAQNLRNVGKYENNTSGHRGIYWNKRDHKWNVQIMINNHAKFLGKFANILEAIAAYKKAAILHFGEYVHSSIHAD